MFHKKRLLTMAVLCTLASTAAYTYAYRGIDFSLNKNKKPIEQEEDFSQKEQEKPIEPIAIKEEPSVEPQPEKEVSEVGSIEEKITPSTKMVYEYYYSQDDIVQRQEEEPPYFLLDLTFSDLLQFYPNWTIVSFSDKEVVMRKTIQGESNEHFVVGEMDGYIAVFYEKEQDGISLHTLTDTPIGALSHEEQVRLADGILVVGEDNLAKILEDYES